jgi:hypothetical protein
VAMRNKDEGLILREGEFMTFRLFPGPDGKEIAETIKNYTKGNFENFLTILGVYSDALYIPSRDRYFVYDYINSKVLSVN